MADEQQKTSGGCCGDAGEWHHCGKRRLAWRFGALILLAGALLLFAMSVSEIKGWKYIGLPVPQSATIAVSGDGEAYGKPDIALASFSVIAEAKTVAEAQKTATEKMNALIAFIKGSGIEEKDIKTTGYNFYPKYEWQEMRIQCLTYPCPQPPGKQVLTGYEVSQSVEVKIRKIDDAGKVLAGLGEKGATNLSGLTFMVENEDALRAEARKEAIDKAKAKADVLAKDLGVTLVRIVSYNEGGDYPIYNFARTMAADAKGGVEMAPVPELPTGENKFVSDVTIVYEIK